MSAPRRVYTGVDSYGVEQTQGQPAEPGALAIFTAIFDHHNARNRSFGTISRIFETRTSGVKVDHPFDPLHVRQEVDDLRAYASWLTAAVLEREMDYGFPGLLVVDSRVATKSNRQLDQAAERIATLMHQNGAQVILFAWSPDQKCLDPAEPHERLVERTTDLQQTVASYDLPTLALEVTPLKPTLEDLPEMMMTRPDIF